MTELDQPTTPIQYNMSGHDQWTGVLHYDLPSLEDPDDIARARSLPPNSRVVEGEFDGLWHISRCLAEAQSVEEVSALMDIFGPALDGTAGYNLHGPNMYWPTAMPQLADGRPGPEEVWAAGIKELDEAQQLSASVTAMHVGGEKSGAIQPVRIEFAKAVAKGRQTMACVELAQITSDRSSGLRGSEIQHLVRQKTMQDKVAAFSIGQEAGAMPSALQAIDPYSPLIVELERYGDPAARQIHRRVSAAAGR